MPHETSESRSTWMGRLRRIAIAGLLACLAGLHASPEMQDAVATPPAKAPPFQLLFDDIADPEVILSAARLGGERVLIVYQAVDPGAQARGVIDPAVLIDGIRREAKGGLPAWGMLDFEVPFYEILAEGPDAPRFAETIATMVRAIRAVKAAFPDTRWCYYGMPQLPYWIGPKHDQDWVTGPEAMKRAQLERAAAICAPIVTEMDWVSPSIYAIYEPSMVKHSPESATRAQGRAWRFASTGLARLLASGKPVIPMVCPWWTPGGTAPYCRVIPRREFIEDIAAPAIEAGASGLALWTCMTYQINRVTAADPSKFGDETNFGTKEWRQAVVLDYLDGKTPADWTDPSVRARITQGMCDATIKLLQDIRSRIDSKLPPR